MTIHFILQALQTHITSILLEGDHIDQGKIEMFLCNSVNFHHRTSSMMSTSNKSITEADIYSLPDTGHLKYDLLEEIGQGTYGLVHRLEYF